MSLCSVTYDVALRRQRNENRRKSRNIFACSDGGAFNTSICKKIRKFHRDVFYNTLALTCVCVRCDKNSTYLKQHKNRTCDIFFRPKQAFIRGYTIQSFIRISAYIIWYKNCLTRYICVIIFYFIFKCTLDFP